MKKEASKEKYVYKTELQLMQEAYEGCCGKPGCKHQMDAYRKHPLPYEPDEDAEGFGPEDDDIFDDYEDDVDFYNSRSSGEDIYDSDMDGFETDDIEEYDDEGNTVFDETDDFIEEVRMLAPGIDEYLETIIDDYEDDYECAMDVVSEFDLPRRKVDIIADYISSFRNGDIGLSDDDYSDSYSDYDEENYGYEDEEGLDMSEADADMSGSEEEEDVIEPNL